MADKNKLKKISAELKKASKMHAAQAEKIENMSKGPSMINIAGAVAGLNNQKKSTAVGSVSPHSHDSSKDNAQPIPPITPPMPDNITGNIGNNFKVQELGKSMFQGEEMANQFAQRQMDKPVMPPSPDPVGDELGNMFMQPFSLIGGSRKPKDPKSKYKVPVEGVSGLQDLGVVKSDKKGQYVVNRNPESVRDTLRFPQGTKHYSGKPYKKGQLIDESDYEDIIKKVNKS